MSWREICKHHSLSAAAIPKWQSTPAHRDLCVAARQRIFGGVPLTGMTEFTQRRGIGPRNKLLLRTKEKEGLISHLQWPYVRPEIMSGRAYREREKLAAKVQAGIKGAAAGAAEAEKDKKKKK